MKYSSTNLPCICMQTNSTCYKQTRLMTIKGVLWHSTGANNPNLKRYIQPLPGQENYSFLIDYIGKNNSGNDYNHASYEAGLNAWIGKNAKGEVISVQSMPWNYRPWGCGGGKKGSCNTGWIQFEICEDNLTNETYFQAAYKEACELTAYLCKTYNIDPYGYSYLNGVKVPNILCHQDSYQLSLGTNHADVYHWFKRYGKNMDTVRNDVANLLKENPKPEIKKEEEDIVTQEQFNIMMNNWIADSASKAANNWSADSRAWAESLGLISGDQYGNHMYQKFITREELVTVLYRALGKEAFDKIMADYQARLSTEEPSDWSAEARNWAENNNIILGDGQNKAYKKLITKEEVVALLERSKNK